MYEYNITIKHPTGKVSHNRVMSEFEKTPEMIARSQMCWYSVGTVFEVNGKAFRKIHVDDAINGYAELEEAYGYDDTVESCIEYVKDNGISEFDYYC